MRSKRNQGICTLVLILSEIEGFKLSNGMTLTQVLNGSPTCFFDNKMKEGRGRIGETSREALVSIQERGEGGLNTVLTVEVLSGDQNPDAQQSCQDWV